MQRGLAWAIASVWLASFAGCGDNALGPDAPSGIPDLKFVAGDMEDTIVATAEDFAVDSCEVIEHCVGAPGRRYLVRFATVTANFGTADMFIGATPPVDVSDDVFEWSPCHQHHHVRDYASYELISDRGVVLTARKQSFCLEDSYPVQPGLASSDYSCNRQGISRGWADSYTADLACQWIDVTGLPSGTYTLRLVLNPRNKLPESNYANNEFRAPVRL